MPVQRLNHAVLYVRDVERSFAFYRDVLGFRARVEIPGRAVFLQAEGSTNDHDLGLFAVGSRAGADLEQAQVVVVGRALRLEEHRRSRDHGLRPEAQDVAVEGVAALDVADIQDGVVEALDGHGGSPREGWRNHCPPTCMNVQVFPFLPLPHPASGIGSRVGSTTEHTQQGSATALRVRATADPRT